MAPDSAAPKVMGDSKEENGHDDSTGQSISNTTTELSGLKLTDGSENKTKQSGTATEEPQQQPRGRSAQPSLTTSSDPPPPSPPSKDQKHQQAEDPEKEALANAEVQQSSNAQEDAAIDTGANEETQETSKPEIQGILTQFESSSEPNASGLTPVTSPSNLPVFQYPPRSSSLGPQPDARTPIDTDGPSPTSASTPKRPSFPSRSSSIVSAPPPPEPEPEPDLPFDFQRFLEQLRHRTADPVAKFLRSFLQEFGKKQWTVGEQQKIVSDFLTFITNRMAQCEVWASVSEAEFDNAKEGMEKLVMNRLYAQTFSPEIPSIDSIRRRKGASVPLGQGRRGQHQEDVERDDVLAQKMRIYSWVQESHLDLKPFSEKSGKFLVMAQQELKKMRSYRAPRDKVICILNSCKILFGFLRKNQEDQSADSFIPLLIYTVIKANPEHLVSNVQYILRFRNPDRLNGEAGYYMSSLLGAIQFIENLDKTNLTVTDEEFEKNVEAAVSAIAERNSQDEQAQQAQPATPGSLANSRPTPSTQTSDQRITTSSSRLQSSEESEENAAVAGLLRTIQKPLSTIGRIFSDEGNIPRSTGPVATPQLTPRPSGAPGTIPTQATQRTMTPSDAAARQANAETTEARRISQAEHQTVVETLSGMFPDLDRDIISDVVRQKEGRVGLAVDACLALSR